MGRPATGTTIEECPTGTGPALGRPAANGTAGPVNLLFEPDSQDVLNVDVPEFLDFEVAWDTGSIAHVLDKVDAPAIRSKRARAHAEARCSTAPTEARCLTRGKSSCTW